MRIALSPAALVSVAGAVLDEQAAAPDRERARVLVVDDDPEIRRMLGRVLRSRYDVCLAEGVTDALEQIRAMPPNVALVDLHLGGADGRLLVRHLREELHDASTRILLCSGDESARRSLPPGVGFVHKPFRLTELMELIDVLGVPARHAG